MSFLLLLDQFGKRFFVFFLRFGRLHALRLQSFRFRLVRVDEAYSGSNYCARSFRDLELCRRCWLQLLEFLLGMSKDYAPPFLLRVCPGVLPLLDLLFPLLLLLRVLALPVPIYYF